MKGVLILMSSINVSDVHSRSTITIPLQSWGMIFEIVSVLSVCQLIKKYATYIYAEPYYILIKIFSR